ncbi:hypothetical protein V9T40_005083 [Parthenolecanium corni]|uniref:Uncharacterized protein n=1 Tax=Parthenolecanium corni TaxID=536013 RepID=A0AAN9TDH4_9HEMI
MVDRGIQGSHDCGAYRPYRCALKNGSKPASECVPSCRWKVFGKVVEILSSLSSGAGDMMVFLMMTLVQ